MLQDTPDIAELLTTVHEFIDGISDKLDGQDKYFALCSMFLLEIVQRELKDWQPILTDDDERLMSFTTGIDKPNEALAELSKMIRDGKLDHRMDELLPMLIQHVKSKVAVTKPEYLVR